MSGASTPCCTPGSHYFPPFKPSSNLGGDCQKCECGAVIIDRTLGGGRRVEIDRSRTVLKSTRTPLLAEQAHVWTLPLSLGRYAYLQTPSRCVTEEEWAQLLTLLEAFKPGLIVTEGNDG